MFYINGARNNIISSILKSYNIKTVSNTFLNVKGDDFFNSKIKPKCVIALFDRSFANGLECEDGWAEDDLLVTINGFPTIYVVDKNNERMINNLKYLWDGNKLSDYILLKFEDMLYLFRLDNGKFLINLEEFELNIDENYEVPEAGRALAMNFIREELNRQGIMPVFDCKRRRLEAN